MWSFGVLDEPPHILWQALRILFAQRNLSFQPVGLSAHDRQALPYRDVWVLAHTQCIPADCRQLIVLGDNAPPFLPYATGLITYGLSCKNTLTPASIDTDGMLVSLQREIVTMTGTRLERQDFSVSRHPRALSVEQTLALTAVLLTMDTPPAEADRFLACLYPHKELVIQHG